MFRVMTLLVVMLLLATGLPVNAQDGGTHNVAFDGVSFSFDAALGTQVHIRQVAGEALDLQVPGGPQPAYTEFDVFSHGVGDAGTTPWLFEAPLAVRVYRVADIAPYDQSQPQVEQLAALLRERPDLSAYMRPEDVAQQTLLPFLPVAPALQVIRAQAHYVDTPAISGIAYITTYRQDASPFMGGEFLYTFQGLSADGQYYVSLVSRLDTDLFPHDLPADFDYQAWIDTLDSYYADSLATLNGASAADFTPSLDAVDAVINSLSFE